MTLNNIKRYFCKFCCISTTNVASCYTVSIDSRNDTKRRWEWHYYLRVIAVLATATWLAGWVAVCHNTHSRYCIKTTKPILKLFRPSDSPIIEAFGTPYADTKFQGNSFTGGVKYTGGGKNWRFPCDFRRTSRFISETVRDRRVPDWMV